jgi:hypothetical protein
LNDDNVKIKFDRFLNQRFVFTRHGENYQSHLSIGYFNSDSIQNMNTGILYNMAMMYMGSELVSNEKFRHIILPVMLFKIDYAKINKFIPNFKKLENKYMEHKDQNMYCMITEKYFNMVALDEFIFKNYKTFTSEDYSVLLFQIIFYLYKMQQRFKDFRHNNLNMKSIRVYVRKSNNDDKMISYKVNDKIFLIPDRGFDIKVGDYDYSSTTDYLTNPRASQDKNMYFDLFIIFSYLDIFFKKHDIKLPNDILKFFEDILPYEIRVSKDSLNTKTVIPIKYKNMSTHKTSPIMILLNNIFFKKYIKQEHKYDNNSITPIDNPNMTITQSITDQSDEPLLIAKKK